LDASDFPGGFKNRHYGRFGTDKVYPPYRDFKAATVNCCEQGESLIELELPFESGIGSRKRPFDGDTDEGQITMGN
jgi:hypothetical protein